MDVSGDKRSLRSWAAEQKPLAQPLVLLIVAILVSALGFWLLPWSVGIPRGNGSVARLHISPSEESASVSNVTALLRTPMPGAQVSGQPYGRTFLTLSGTVRVPPGRPAVLYMDLQVAGGTTLEAGGPGWTGDIHGQCFAGTCDTQMQKTFAPGTTTTFDLAYYFQGCGCVTYTPPYLEVSTVDIMSDPPETPSTWTAGIQDNAVELISPPDQFIDPLFVTAYPQSPVSPPSLGQTEDWSWPGTSDGYVVVADPGASDERERRLFVAGLLFGIAGSAWIAVIQALFSVREAAAKERQSRRVGPFPSGLGWPR